MRITLDDLRKMRAGDVLDVDVSSFGLRPMAILESVRFACTSGISLSRGTIEAASEVWGSGIADRIPMERFRDELSRVVTSNRVEFGLSTWRRIGVLRTMVPELQALSDFGSDGHKDIWEHSFDVLRNGRDLPADVMDEVRILSGILCEPEDRLLRRVELRNRLSLLLHDVGKMQAISLGSIKCPACHRKVVLRSRTSLLCDACGATSPMDRAETASRRIMFRGHEAISGRIVSDMLTRLRFSRWMVEKVSRDCVLHRLNPGRQDTLLSHDNEVGRVDSAAGKRSRKTPIETLIATLADVRPGGECDPWVDLDEMLRWHIIASDSSTRTADHRRVIDELRSLATRVRRERADEVRSILANRPLLDGAELQSMFGLGPGPWIGEVHRRLRADKLADPIGHDRDRATSIARDVVESLGR